MAIKSIIAHFDGSQGASNRLALAVDLAKRFEAHLTALCVGVAPEPPAVLYGAFAVDVVGPHLDDIRKDVDRLTEEAGRQLAASGVPSSTQPVVVMALNLPAVIGRITRFADLVLVGPPFVGRSVEANEQILEAALFDGAAAVLVCPDHRVETVGEKVAIAWNGSREALMAVRQSMPFLAAARSVEILLVDPDKGTDATQDTSTEDLTTMLSRHGVSATVREIASGGRAVGEAIDAHVAETEADLMVMGAYGHSRFREFVLGGATRTVLREVPVPVLMCH